MSLEQAIKHGKEHRKPYYHSGRFDRSCRPHGGCPYCEQNREHSTKVRELSADEQARQAMILEDNLLAIENLAGLA